MRVHRIVPIPAKEKIAIIVEGQCESWYIQMIKRNERSLPFDFEPKIPQRKKLEDQFEAAKKLANDYSKVFWIIDFDVIIRETRSWNNDKETPLVKFNRYYLQVNQQYKGKIYVVINNPCIEYWLLLHFIRTSKYFDTCDGAAKQLKNFLPDYEKTQKFYTRQDNDIYLRLKNSLDFAKQNASKISEYDARNPQAGISNMHIFFDEIFKQT